jgi:hypothetical protein
VGHYNRHLAHDEEKIRQADVLANPDSPAYNTLALILKRAEPMSVLDWFRDHCPEFRDILPTNTQFGAIVHGLKNLLEQNIRGECGTVITEFGRPVVSLAVDGWSDSRARRYEGVTVRQCNPRGGPVRFLALKEVGAIHDSASELAEVVRRVIAKYGLERGFWNICTDRFSMNLAAFRENHTSLDDFYESTWRWLPCVCHFLNNLLSLFLNNIKHRTGPIFRLQQRFRKKGPFITFLAQHGCFLSIPSVSPTRWYSAHELFVRLETLWPFMKAFATQEQKRVPELNDGVKRDIELLKDLTHTFVKAQTELEGNGFGIGSLFIGHFASIQEQLLAFTANEPEVARVLGDYIQAFQQEYQVEWDVFILMTFLNPALQWLNGRQYTEESEERIRGFLVRRVTLEMSQEASDRPSEPATGDYHTYCPISQIVSSPAEEQVNAYRRRRTSGHPLSLALWFNPTPEFKHLSSVALQILSLLTTSASVERGFSVARHVATDFQMAMRPETLANRVFIQANWELVETGLLRDILALGRTGWKRMEEDYQNQKLEVDNHWRLHLSPRPPIDWENEDSTLPNLDASDDAEPEMD